MTQTGSVQSSRGPRASQSDKWIALREQMRTGQPVAWSRASRTHRLRMAGIGDLPVAAMRDLFAFAEWSEKSAVDVHGDVRDVLAQRADLPEDLLRQLLADPNPIVRATATRLQPLPEDLVEGLLLHGATVLAALENPSLSGAWVHRLVGNLLREDSPAHARLTSDAFRAEMDSVEAHPTMFAQHTVLDRVLDAVLRQPNTPAGTLDRLARRPEMPDWVLEAIAVHPRTARETLTFLEQERQALMRAVTTQWWARAE